jgi:adenine-specific DNA-methyltransferase
MNELPEKLDLTSLDIAAGQREKLRQLFPEAITEGGKVDFDRLKATLGEVVDTGKERYGMNWPGKSECFRTIQAPSRATLRPCREESVHFDTAENLIIEGDNLEALKLLQKGYLGKVKMIYIDPPYNTGNEFIYPDNYSESLDTYLSYTGQVDAGGRKFSTNTETDGRFHSKWMNMMYPRLFLARNLLREDGVICISIDDAETDNLRKICDEILGEENFIDTIAVEMSTTFGPKTVNAQQGTIVKNVEFVHIYRKSAEFDKTTRTPLLDGIDAYDTHYSIWMNDDGTLGALSEKLLADEQVAGDISKYGFLDRNKFSINNLSKLLVVSEATKSFIESNLRRIARIDRPPVAATGISTQLGCWKKYDADHRCYFLTTLENGTLQALMPLSLNYRTSDDYKPMFGRTVIRGDLWKGFHQDMGNVAKEGDIVFSNGKKPVRLIRQLIKWAASSAKDSLILDFFAGSGTTAQAVLELNKEDGGNRKFILVQLPEPTGREDYKTIADITKERVRRVIQKISRGEEEGLTRRREDAKGEKQLELDAELLTPDLSAQKPDSKPLRGFAPSREPGFKVFKLDTSNFKTWDGMRPESPEAVVQQLELHVDHVLAGRTQEDILTELLLKSGFPLCTQVERMEFSRESAKDAKFYYSVEEGAMLICLEKDLTAQMVKELADKKPSRVICLDAGFQGSDQLKTNAVQTMKARGVLKFQTV